jgi:molybdopterin synthase sulfur carrier subunit
MSITVKFFAGLREQMGRAEERIPYAPDLTVGDVWERVAGGRDLTERSLCALNLEYVERTHPVADGDEVAFFPPVTGG